MSERINPDGNRWRGLPGFNGVAKGRDNTNAESAPLRQSGSPHWDDLKKYGRPKLRSKDARGASAGDMNHARPDEASIAPRLAADAEAIAAGSATSEAPAVAAQPGVAADRRSIAEIRADLQKKQLALNLVIEGVDATLQETRSAFMKARTEADLADQELRAADDAHEKAGEQVVDWYTRAVIDEVRGSFPPEAGAIDDAFVGRVASWLRDPPVDDVAELAGYGVGAQKQADALDQLMESALERVTARNDPEAARLHDALDAAHFEKERAENVSTVMNAQLSRLYERVRTFEDASVAAHLAGSTVKAACDATAVVADDEVDTPATEQARSVAQVAERVWIGLNDMLGEINDRTRS